MPVPSKILNGQPVAGPHAQAPSTGNLNVRGSPVDPHVQQQAAMVDAIARIHKTSTQGHASFMGVSLDSANKMLQTLDKLFQDFSDIHLATLGDRGLSMDQLKECVAIFWSTNRLHDEARCAIFAKIQELTPQAEVRPREVETGAKDPPTCGVSNDKFSNVREILRPLIALPTLEQPTQAGLYVLIDTVREAMRLLTLSGNPVEQTVVHMLLIFSRLTRDYYL